MKKKPQNPAPISMLPHYYWQQQSPIIIRHDETYFVPDLDPLTIHYDHAPYAGEFDDHPNFVLDSCAPGKAPYLMLGNVRAELVKIHLHTPSEHDMEGEDAAIEVHLIHKIYHPEHGSEFIVLGVLCDLELPKKGKKEKDKPETPFFTTWAKDLDGKDTSEVHIHESFDPRQIIPNYGEFYPYYRYEGSLTTEPYSEVVTWIVLGNFLHVTSTELKALKHLAHVHERQPQPLNRRYVLRNFKDSSRK